MLIPSACANWVKQEKKKRESMMVPKSLHVFFFLSQNEYNKHNLHGYIFPAAQNSHARGEVHQEHPFGTLCPEEQGSFWPTAACDGMLESV